MRRRGRGEGLKRRRPSRAVVGRMWIRVGMGVRGRMRVGRVRRWWRRWPLVEVRIILIHHLGTAHHPARARHPRAGLSTCVPERRTTRSYTISCFHFAHFPPHPSSPQFPTPFFVNRFSNDRFSINRRETGWKCQADPRIFTVTRLFINERVTLIVFRMCCRSVVTLNGVCKVLEYFF